MIARLLALALLLFPLSASAEMRLPSGFAAQVYVTGEGFDTDTSRGVRGIPGTSTLAFDRAGFLYMARTGRRYVGGEIYDLWPIFRFPAGGTRLTPENESRFFYGPPLPNPQVGATRRGHELFVTTFDRERKVGAVYRVVDGRAELFAGGTPDKGVRPVLRQPEAAAVDSAGNVYVTDRAQNVIVRLGPDGRVLDPAFVTVARPRLLAIDEQLHPLHRHDRHDKRNRGQNDAQQPRWNRHLERSAIGCRKPLDRFDDAGGGGHVEAVRTDERLDEAASGIARARIEHSSQLPNVFVEITSDVQQASFDVLEMLKMKRAFLRVGELVGFHRKNGTSDDSGLDHRARIDPHHGFCVVHRIEVIRAR